VRARRASTSGGYAFSRRPRPHAALARAPQTISFHPRAPQAAHF